MEVLVVKFKIPTEKIDKLLFSHGYVNEYEVGDGWFNILDEYFHGIKSTGLKGFKLECVKEKWGSLYIYTNMDSNEHVENWGVNAMDKSSSTCEFCGFPGEDYLFGFWHKTCCEFCAEKYGGSKPKHYKPTAFWGNFR